MSRDDVKQIRWAERTIRNGGVVPAGEGMPAIGLEAEFTTVVDGVAQKPEDVFNGAHFRIPFELMRVYSPSAEVQGHGPGQEAIRWPISCMSAWRG